MSRGGKIVIKNDTEIFSRMKADVLIITKIVSKADYIMETDDGPSQSEQHNIIRRGADNTCSSNHHHSGKMTAAACCSFSFSSPFFPCMNWPVSSSPPSPFQPPDFQYGFQ